MYIWLIFKPTFSSKANQVSPFIDKMFHAELRGCLIHKTKQNKKRSNNQIIIIMMMMKESYEEAYQQKKKATSASKNPNKTVLSIK